MANDIQLTDNNDLDFSLGDLKIDQSDTQHVSLIVDSFPGFFKENPIVGFGVSKYLKSGVTPTRFKSQLKIQLGYDGYTNPAIRFNQGKLNIEI